MNLQAQLLESLGALGLTCTIEHQPSWHLLVPFEDSRGAKGNVYVSIEEDRVVLLISTTLVAALQIKELMDLNFKLHFAKVSSAPNGNLVVISEIPPAAISAASFRTAFGSLMMALDGIIALYYPGAR